MQENSEDICVNDSKLIWRDKKGAWFCRLFPVLIFAMCFGVMLGIIMKVLGAGYLPRDDALRHAGFAVTDKVWEQVLVCDGSLLDVHYGWHMFLRGIHYLGIETPDGLVMVEVAVLFLLFVLPPLFLFKRPETWVFALLISYSVLEFETRLFIGRPFIASMAVLAVVLLRREKLNAKAVPWGLMAGLGFGLVLSVWWRMTWFLYLFPIVAFAAAGLWRAAGRLSALLLGAVAAGALLCGDFLLPVATFQAVFDALGSSEDVTALVGELQPLTKFAMPFVVLILILISTHLRGGDLKKVLVSPVFFVFAGSCFLSAQAVRWFAEFGTVSLLVMMAEEIDGWVEKNPFSWFSSYSFSRAAIVAAAVALLFVSYAADEGGRWGGALKRDYVDVADPEIQEGLPGENGIIYNTSMGIFYETFFRNPHESWRYVLGFEPAFMTEDNLRILRLIQWNQGAVERYQPWVEKMRPEDRLWLSLGIGAKPRIKGLEWTQMSSRIWSGRKAVDSEAADLALQGVGSSSVE